ncbi:MAG: hypothetical protein ACE5DQ_02970 [Candidatus Paceibacterota bacterium]
MIEKITVKVGEDKFELSQEQASVLYHELGRICNRSPYGSYFSWFDGWYLPEDERSRTSYEVSVG